jgi:hypothetical protein
MTETLKQDVVADPRQQVKASAPLGAALLIHERDAPGGSSQVQSQIGARPLCHLKRIGSVT